MTNIPASAGQQSAKRAGTALLVTVAVVAALMLVLGDRAYPWIKAAHVVAIISWMAGLLYLPRLFIYHCDAPKGSVQSETFKVMETRLLNIIMSPAMIIAWVLGLWLAWTGNHFGEPWFLAKLLMVFGLSATHGYLSAATQAFSEDRNDKPTRHWRIINEVPTLLMIAIVILVIVKPF
jgi:protoporphyrinogen IX oxidase